MSAPIAQRRLTAYARRLGFGPNTALLTRYLDALHTLTGRPSDALLSEAAAFFRNRRIGEQEYARYFVLPEERLLYGLWLVRYAIQNQNGALMFVARGAEPFQQAWEVWKSILGCSYPFPDSFALRVCRGYPSDTEPDGEPKHFLSRSIASSLSDDERAGAVPRHVWEQVEHVAMTTGLKDELDPYLRAHWGIRDGLHGLMGGSAKTLQTALMCLADFGIDRSYRRLIWRNRRSHFGTEGITPLIQARTCTVSTLVEWVRRTNTDRFGRMFDEEDIFNMEAGLVRLIDRRGVLPEQCRELVSSVMRIYLNARLLKSLRHRTEHRARPLLNILLRSTVVGRMLGGTQVQHVASVDEATVSGTSLIAAELAALSFNSSLQHVNLNIAQRTASVAEFLTNEGIVDACAVGGIWFQEDMSHFYRGCYDGDMRYAAFEALARRLWDEQQQVNRNRAACLALLQDLDQRLQSFVPALALGVPTRDVGCHVQPRYPIEVILSQIVKLYLRRDHAFALECQRIVLDDDVLQMVSSLQCDFTGWFFLRQMRQRALEWLDTHEKNASELRELQELDQQVRFFELARYFERMASRYEADEKELQRAATGFMTQLEGPVTAFLRGHISFDSLRTGFYERYQCGIF
jgi:hypothetical protein